MCFEEDDLFGNGLILIVIQFSNNITFDTSDEFVLFCFEQ